ncbi:MAG: ABC transporter permease [Desulfobacterales bacterium]
MADTYNPISDESGGFTLTTQLRILRRSYDLRFYLIFLRSGNRSGQTFSEYDRPGCHRQFSGQTLSGLFLFILSAIGIGLMISSLAVTQQQGLMGAFLFMVPAIILSGFTTPIANMPVVVQKITLLNPLRYFMVVIRGVFLENAPFHLLIGQYWPMAIIGFVNLTVAAWLFRHRIN